MRRRLPLALVLLAAFVVVIVPTAPSLGTEGRTGNLDERLGAATRRLEHKRRVAGLLTTDIDRFDRRIGGMQRKIDVVQRRVARLTEIQHREQVQLDAIQVDLRRERARLVRLRARLARTRRVLARRLVALYQAPKPDLVTVVLNADGFADLLERTDFLERIADSDRRIVLTVPRGAR